MAEDELKEVEELHRKYLNNSFLSSLGSEFLREPYSRIIYDQLWVWNSNDSRVKLLSASEFLEKVYLIYQAWNKILIGGHEGNNLSAEISVGDYFVRFGDEKP